MKTTKKTIALGDSIIKGVVLNIEVNGKMHYAMTEHNIIDQVADNLRTEVVNLGKMGCTVEAGERILDRHLPTIQDGEYVILCYGGNDSDYNWREIAMSPSAEHHPKTPLAVFEETYARIIAKVRQAGLTPVVLSLPEMDAERYYKFFTAVFSEEEKRNVSRWLKNGPQAIAAGHELYNEAVKRVAKAAEAILVDVSKAFANVQQSLCVDGIHPNHIGQKQIAQLIKQAL
jgi:lysophospholipase L1-like esterase